jgi:LysR family glycine cleavage system transcriptional activator
VPVDFDAQNLDAAIRSGHGSWPGLHVERLVDIELIPVCSPALMASARLERPEDLAKVRLLHSMARPNDWAAWIAAAGAKVDPAPGLRFENSALAYEAASLDIGVAIGVKVFVQRLLQTGSMVAPFETTCRTGEGYYLTWPSNTRTSAPLMKFLAWIREQIASENAPAPVLVENH